MVVVCFGKVLDEADVLLDMEFEKSLDDILKIIPKERRTFLFSATMTDKVGTYETARLNYDYYS